MATDGLDVGVDGFQRHLHKTRRETKHAHEEARNLAAFNASRHQHGCHVATCFRGHSG